MITFIVTRRGRGEDVREVKKRVSYMVEDSKTN